MVPISLYTACNVSGLGGTRRAPAWRARNRSEPRGARGSGLIFLQTKFNVCCRGGAKKKVQTHKVEVSFGGSDHPKKSVVFHETQQGDA
jgi:hypothetical protein